MAIGNDAIECCEESSRFIKVIVAFVIGSIAAGTSFQARDTVATEVGKVTSYKGTVAFLSNGITLSFILLYLVNIMCVLYSVIGLACVRRRLFGGSRKWRGIRCCLGSFICGTFQQIMVCVTLAMQVGMSWCYLLCSIFLGILQRFCNAGGSVTNSFQGLLDNYHGQMSYQADAWSPINWFMNLNVEKYCLATEGVQDASYDCFWGCGLSVASQAIMLMAISEEKGHIQAQELSAQGDDLRNLRRDADDSHSSSSDSDLERDPRKKRHGRPDRDWKQPKGYQPRR